MNEIIGWVSSAILVLTISAQLRKQWRAGTSKGVSKWLFIGQFLASLGFVSYSALIGNWVFVVTNGLLGVEALLGLGIVYLHRRSDARHSLHPEGKVVAARPDVSGVQGHPLKSGPAA